MFTEQQLTLQDLIARGVAKDTPFARDLSSKRLYTPKQHQWVEKLIAEATKAPALKLDIKGIVDLFETAKQHLKYPKIVLRLMGQYDVRLKPAKNGNIYIDNGVYQGAYYGKITPAGEFFHGKDLAPHMVAALEGLLTLLASDPAVVAQEYGRLTGNCCFCARELTDARSITVGYGPVCADHFGLPWGN